MGRIFAGQGPAPGQPPDPAHPGGGLAGALLRGTSRTAAYALARTLLARAADHGAPAAATSCPIEVTAGLDTVGMRCPAHPVCRAMIQAADVPVAAPSGQYLRAAQPHHRRPHAGGHGRQDRRHCGRRPLRGGGGVHHRGPDSARPHGCCGPAGITLEQLRAALGEVAVDPAVTRLMGAGERPRAPGMKYRHYAPKAPVTVVTGEPERSAARISPPTPDRGTGSSALRSSCRCMRGARGPS